MGLSRVDLRGSAKGRKYDFDSYIYTYVVNFYGVWS